MAHNLLPGPNWIPGTVIEHHSTISGPSESRGGQVWKRHVDMLHEVGDIPMEEPVD